MSCVFLMKNRVCQTGTGAVTEETENFQSSAFLSHPPITFFLSQMAGTTWQGQWYRCQWNLPKHLSNVGHPHPTANPGAGNPPAHWTPTSAPRWAEQGCLPHSGHCWPDSFSTLSTPWCKPSQAVPMSELMIPSPSISQCRHLIPTESHLNFSCFSFHLIY